MRWKLFWSGMLTLSLIMQSALAGVAAGAPVNALSIPAKGTKPVMPPAKMPAPKPVPGKNKSAQLIPVSESAENAFAQKPHDGKLYLSAGSFDPLKQGSPLRAATGLAKSAAASAGANATTAVQWLVQFNPTKSDEVQKLVVSNGGEVLAYVPHDAFRIRIAANRVVLVRSHPDVRAVVPVYPIYKIDTDLTDGAGNVPDTLNGDPSAVVEVLLWSGTDRKEWLERAVRLGAEPALTPGASGQQMQIRVERARLLEIAGWEDVIFISPWREKEVQMNNVRTIVKVNEMFNRMIPAGLQLDGRTETVNVSDTGIQSNHPDLSFDPVNGNAKIARSFDYGYTYPDSVTGQNKFHVTNDPGGHGTHVAGIIAGTGVGGQNELYKGVAPSASLIAQYFYAENTTLMQNAWSSGARISNNSWVYTNAITEKNGYSYYDWQVDSFVYQQKEQDPKDLVLKQTFVYVGAAGNNGQYVLAPNAGKNMITVGSTLNNPLNYKSISWYSSRGPVRLNRIKPDVLAPGENVIAARSANSNYAAVDGAGLYARLSGTSMATPVVSGLAALMRQYYKSKGFIPSAALIKATLINGTEELTKTDGSLVSRDDQGWGIANLTQSIGSPKWTWSDGRDVADGQTVTYKVNVPDSTKPLVSTLVWTDAPIDLAAISNSTGDVTTANLDLTLISPSGVRYTSNTTNNNVEKVSINNPQTGEWTIQVSGTRVPQVAGTAQPFAMVVRGAEDPLPKDSIPPSAINAIQASTNGTNVTLSWTKPADHADVTDYYVYADGVSEPLASSKTNRVTVSGLMLAPDTLKLTVKAVDYSGNVSPSSMPVSVNFGSTDSLLANGGSKTYWVKGNGSSVMLNANNGVISVSELNQQAMIGNQTAVTNLLLKKGTLYKVQFSTATGSTASSAAATIRIAEQLTSPSNFRVTGKSSGTVTVSWDRLAGQSAFEVFRDGVIAGETTQTIWLDSNLTPDQTYRYQVRAKDASGAVSLLTAEQYVTTDPKEITTVTIFYKNSTMTPPNYFRYRISGQEWVGLPGALMSSSSFEGYDTIQVPLGSAESLSGEFRSDSNTDTNNGNLYSFNRGVFTVTDGVVKSGAPVSDQTAPAVPANLRAEQVTNGTAELLWSASSDNVAVASYELSRGDQVVYRGTLTGFTDIGLSGKTSYSYKVRALDHAGNASAWSAAVVVATLADPVNTVNVYYKNATLGAEPNLLYQPFTGSWIPAPGLKMTSSGIKGYAYRSVSVGGDTGIIAQFNNGTSSDNNGGKNYVLPVGTWTVANGTISEGEPVADEEAPTAPAGLKIDSQTSDSVTISWSKSSDNSVVSGYIVYRDGQKQSHVSGTTFTDSGLQTGIVYRYYVIAVDDSENLSKSSAILEVKLERIINNQVVIFYKSSVLGANVNIHYRPDNGNWTTAPGLRMNPSVNGYATITLSIGAANGITAAFNNGSTWENNGGKNYTLAVGTWTITNGTVTSGGLDTEKPTAPSGIATEKKSHDSITLKWSASTDNNAVAGYEVYRNGSKVGNTSATVFTDSGLSPSTSYTYTLLAFDAAGNLSALSTAYSETTDELKVGQVIIYYKNASFGSNVNFHYRQIGGTQWTTAPGVKLIPSIGGYSTITVAATGGVGVVGAFNNGTVWENNGGKDYSLAIGTWTISPGSIVSGAPIVDNQAPTVPSDLGTASKTGTAISLRWTASTDNTGVTGYDVFRNGTKVGSSTTPTYTDSGLSGSTTYKYTVQAFDAAGNRSAMSAEWSETTDKITVGQVVIYYKNTNFGSNVNFHYRQTNGASWTVAPGVKMNASAAPGFVTLTVDATGGVGVTGAFNNGTTWENNGGKDYVLAIGTWTISPGSIVSGAPIVDNQAPTVPADLSTASKTGTSISLRWTASTDNTGVTGYEVFRNGTKVGSSTTATYTDSGLSGSTTYKYTVQAFDAAGNRSAMSAEWSETTDKITVGQVIIYYKNTTFGSNVNFHYRQTNGASWTVAPGVKMNPSAAPGFVTLTADATGGVGVTGAFNNGTAWENNGGKDYTLAIGTWTISPGSIVSGAPIVDNQAPTVPADLSTASKTGTSISLRWTASTDNTGVTGYDVFRNGTKVGSSTTATYTDSGLSGGTTYKYTVQAVDAAGNRSAMSAEWSETTEKITVGQVIIYYKNTNFGSNVNFHYRQSNGTLWTAVPGLKMNPSAAPGFMTVTVDATGGVGVTGAFNNGTTWENNGGKDYTLAIGTWTISPGSIVSGAPIVDNTPPSTPGGLSTESKTGSSITLKWTASTDNTGVTGYDIFRNGNKVGSSSGLTYTDSGLSASTAYKYNIQAFDAAGNKSPLSAEHNEMTSAAPVNMLTIYYQKRSTLAYIHYMPDGGLWTVAPGLKMPDAEFSGFAKVELNLGNSAGITAAFNNGANQWDNNGGKNYRFTPGSYTVSNGVVKAGRP